MNQFSWTHKVEYTTTPDLSTILGGTNLGQPKIKSAVMEDFQTIASAIGKHRGHSMSPEQLDICRYIYDNHTKPGDQSRHVMIDSVAGSGKTSTLLMCLWFLPLNTKVLFLSFSKSVQQTLESQVQRLKNLGRPFPDCSTFTCHAHGLSALKRAAPGGWTESVGTDNKYRVVKSAMEELGCQYSLSSWTWHMQTMLKLLMNLALDCGTAEAQWSEEFVVQTGKKYGVPTPPYNAFARSKTAQKANQVYHDYMKVLHRACDMCCQRQSHFDFTDMVYLPIRLGLPLLQYDVVLVDEAQDLNAVQIEMIARSILPPTSGGRGGRVIFVGDNNQAIYGFRGADTQAIETVTRRFNPVQFPLHTCWRCPTNVISVAQSVVPYIRARPGAPGGVARKHQGEWMISERLRERDRNVGYLILCRTNAPLIKLAIQLLTEGVDCFLAADTLRGQLEKLLNIIVEQDWIQGRRLQDRVDHYRDWKRKSLLEEGEELIEKNDQLDSLYAIVTALRDPSVNQVRQVISRLFTVPTSASGPHKGASGTVKLATIHQCKGQEEDVVFLIKPSLLPHPLTEKSADTIETRWQLDQEENLRYVAITRAKQEFHIFEDNDALSSPTVGSRRRK